MICFHIFIHAALRQGFKLIMVENNADNVLLNIALGFLDIYYLATNYVAVSALFLSFLAILYV